MRPRRKAVVFLPILVALVALAFLFVATPSPQQLGITRYVNNTDPTCRGNSPCYTTIQAAVNAASPGSTIQIQAGTYHEKVAISGKNNTATATEADRIVIEADPLAVPASVVVSGAGQQCNDGDAFQIKRSKFITIRGLTITGAGGQAISLVGGGINKNQAIHIERNRIFDNGSSECDGGITLVQENPDTLIVNNLIYGNGRNGISIINAGSGLYHVVNNTIHANQWNGVNLVQSQGVFLVNNIITQNGTAPDSTGGRFGLQREKSSRSQPQQIHLLNNFICGNRLGEINGPLLDTTDSANLTPQGTEGAGVSASLGCQIPANVYANVNGSDGLPNTADDDFTLARHSPAIDEGMDPLTLGLNVLFNAIFESDFSTEGVRPSDGNADRQVAFDMGAFEFPNSPPVANAGPDQTVFTEALVTLDGSQSRDPEGAALTFRWTVVSQPAGSAVSLNNPSSAKPQFTPLILGSYAFHLIVNDGQLDSAADTVTVTARVNNPPTANAGGPYTGTVGVPIQFTGTGTDPDGDPISFSWSFGDGGTAIGASPTHAYATTGTFPVTLTVTDSMGANSTSQTNATVSPALVLNPIGNKTVNLGETLILTVSATSIAGTPSLFVSPLPLPNHATFNAVTGEFRFTPDTTQVGSFQLAFSAVSGNQSVSETIIIMVPQPPLGGTTGVRGKVENLNDTPLGNVKVTLKSSGHTAFSATDGFFTLTGVPSGRQELIINGREANLGVFAILAVPVNLIDGVLNNLPSAITLPDVDVAAEVQVSQTETTTVANPHVPGVELTIPPATAKNSDGTPFTGKLSINPVPDYGRPESRPEELRPGMAITIQPAGVRFNPPAQLTFPNADNMPPGSELNLWSLSPDTGTFSIVGKMVVDGQSIITVEGGVTASAWHFPMAPAGSSNTDVDESPGLSNYPDKECLQPASSTVALQSGCLGVEFSLPSYRSLGVSRSLKFVYKSNRAYPQPLIPFNATIPVRAAVPPKLSYSLSVGGVEQGTETFINTSGLDEGRDETIRAVASFDASQLKTGVYPYRTKLTSNYLNSAISSFISDKVLVVNEQKSPFGAGWGIEGVGRLHFNADGSALVTDGNGLALTFRREILGQVSWWPGDGDANDIAGANHGTLQNGATFAAGKVGKAFSFDGVDDRVQISPVPQNLQIHDALTITAWVNPSPTSSDLHPVVARNGLLTDQLYSVHYIAANKSIVFGWFDGQHKGVDSPANAIVTGQWNHVAVTRDDSQFIRIYINGVEVARGQGTRPTASAGAQFNIGSSQPGNDFQDFQGLIDEVQIYNRALPASDIQDMFNSPGKPLFAGNFTTPAGDFSTLAGNPDGTFTRTLKDGTKIHFNAQGLQTSVVDRNGNTISYGYDGNGKLISITDPAGLSTAFAYTGSLLSSITDPAGRTTAVQHDGAGNLIKATFPDVSTKSFGYDSKHLMTSETNERGFVVQREYDSVGRLIRATLPDGSIRTATSAQSVGFADPSTGVGTITNPAPVRRPGDALGRFTDGKGNQQVVKIGRFGAPLRITDSLGQTTLIERRSGNDGTLVGGATFALGQLGQAFSLDGKDDLVSGNSTSGFPLGSSPRTITAWIKSKRVVGDRNIFHYGVSNPNLPPTNFHLYVTPGGQAAAGNGFGFGVVVGKTFVDDDRFHFVAGVYDGPSTNVARIYVDGLEEGSKLITTPGTPEGTWTIGRFLGGGTLFNGLIDEVQIFNRALSPSEVQAIFTAGSAGNRSAPPSGQISWWQGEGGATDSAGGHGLPTKIARPNGAVTTMSYDSRGDLLSSTDPVGATTAFTYEPSFNQVMSVKDPKGTTTTITYDAKGNPTQIRDSQGNVTQMTYDVKGLLSSVTSAMGKPEQNTTTFSYDARGNLLTTTDPKGNVTTLAYDGVGNVSRSTDGEGGVTEFTYDPFNRLTSVLDPSLNVTFYTYDAKGDLTEVTDARGQSTTFAYDPLDRLVSATNPLGFTETFTYDANGNLTSTTNRNLQTVSFNYDALNRLIQKTLPGNQITTFAYDSVGNLTSVIDPDSTINMAYDLANRLTSTTASSSSVPAKTISYAYDLNGNRLTMTDLQGGVTSYAYDSLNRLASVTNPLGKVTSLSYDSLGRRTSMTHGNKGVTTYRYDAASQLTRLAHQLGAVTINSFDYTYDRVGNRKTKVDRNGTFAYTYDTLNRLVEAMNPLPSNPLETYNHDSVGNRTNSNQNGASVFNQSNQLTGDANFTYQYDNNGNLTLKTPKAPGPFTSYEYDAENKLVRVVTNGTTVNYKYDGLGRRVEKEVNDSVTIKVARFIYDNEDILLELDVSNNIVARYTHGPGIDEPLIMEKGGASFFYHADGLGSITEITNQSGTVVQAYTYSSFGNIESQLDPNFVQPYTFTAREHDPETDLYFNRGRTYDWRTGRFLQEDSFGGFVMVPQSLNTYPYTLNNPLSQIDSDGLFPEPASVVGGLIVGGVSGAILGYAEGGILGLVSGGIVGAVVGGAVGFVTEPLSGGAAGSIAGAAAGVAANLVGTVIEEMLGFSTLGKGELPVIQNSPPKRPKLRKLPPELRQLRPRVNRDTRPPPVLKQLGSRVDPGALLICPAP